MRDKSITVPLATDLRASTRSILERRSRRSCRVLVTGGTGFIGSHVAVELLRRGYSVVLLARRKGPLSAAERVARLLDWFDLAEGDRSRLKVLEGSLDTPDLGLGRDEYAGLAGTTEEIVHCASNTSFSDRKRSEVEKANVENLGHLLDLAAQSPCYFFHHVSTAYVAGKTSGICPEELVRPDEFTNVYEETKCRAEANTAAACARAGIRLSIYRPSVIYGDSETGRTLLFNGLYYPVRTVAFLKDLFEKDLTERGGGRAVEMGVRRESDGRLYLPLRVEADGRGGVNLIPIDYFVRAFTAIFEDGLDGGIFHVTNVEPTGLAQLAEFTERFFSVDGISPAPAGDFASRPRNGLEILFDQYVQAYRPYMNDTRRFDAGNADAILRRRGVERPEFDYGVFSRCMKFAEDVEWGARLFERTGGQRAGGRK